MLSSASAVRLAPDEDDEPVTIYPPERKKLRERLERADRLEEEVRELREKYRRLQEELRRYRACAPMLAASDRTAEAGSIPSSRVFYRRPVHKDPLPTGGQRGHPGRARERPVPNAPPMKLTLERCTDCGTRLGEPFEVRRRTITDLPPPQPLVFDVEISRYNCPGCRRRVEAECPYPKHQQYGFSLIARVVQLRLLGLSTAKIADYFEGAHGVHLSTAAVLKMERWAAESVAPLYESLKAQVADHAVIHADETKFRIGGENGWLWVFSHPEAVVYRIAPSRGQDVVLEVLGGARGTIVHDGWVPYDIVRTASHQFDLLHANRWLEKEEILHRLEPRPLLREVPPKLTAAGPPPREFLEFADGVRGMLRDAIGWSERHPEATGAERRHFSTTMRWRTVDHLRREWRDAGAARIAGELWKRRKSLYTFLAEPGVAWHNNEAETQIRQGVLYRKISGGRRSWTGAWVLERLLSIYRTCRKRSVSFVKVLKDALSGSGYPEFGAPSGRPQT
ncbi:MAG: IS66 family transposase [Thermoplasmata archaeon]|nr:IS66 family transposase [Thermoplasmata archaeon]